MCGKGSCVTCDFFFPPNLHICPVCVATAHSNLTPRRKKYTIAGFTLAVVASLGVALYMANTIVGGPPLLSLVILGLGTQIPAAIGTGVAWAAIKPGGPNPISVYVAIVWNALLLGAMMLFRIYLALHS